MVVTQQQSQPLQHQALPNGRTGPGGTENDQVKDGPSIIVIGKNVTFTYPILSSSIMALRMLALFIPKTISKAKQSVFMFALPTIFLCLWAATLGTFQALNQAYFLGNFMEAN